MAAVNVYEFETAPRQPGFQTPPLKAKATVCVCCVSARGREYVHVHACCLLPFLGATLPLTEYACPIARVTLRFFFTFPAAMCVLIQQSGRHSTPQFGMCGSV